MRRGLRERLALMLVVAGIAAAIPAVVHVTVGQTGVNLIAKVLPPALRSVKALLALQAVLLAFVIGLVWLATALVPALTMDFTRLGWWIGHEVELDGILIVGIAVAVDLARAAQSRPLAGDLRGADLVASEDAFLGSHVRALTVRLADKDEYTERHTRRVALRVGGFSDVVR